MANRAAQELKAVTQDVDQVEDAATALSRLTPDQGDQRAPADDEADFGTPEAIATAVLASVILGPIGGVLVGGAQGWLKKKSDQALLDQIADEQSVLSDASDIYANQLNSFRETATNPNDLEQIETMQTGLDVAREFMGSADADLRAQGVQMQAGVDSQMNAYATRQETQRIAADNLVKSDKRQLGLDEYNRYSAMQTDFDTQSAPWLARKEAANTALAALQGGSAAQIHAAMILFNKTLDPNSAVLGEERAAVTEMGTLLDTVYNFFGEKFTGQKLNATQRRELGAAILTISDTSTQFQLQREGRFGERAAQDLPIEYQDRFTLVDDTPGAEPLDIPADTRDSIANIPGATADATERLGQFIVDDLAKTTAQTVRAAEATRDFMQGAGEAINTKADQAETFLNNLLRFGTGGSRPTN